jgi:hypothetical protein
MALLADAILIVHLLFVLFVVGGLLAIWSGALLGWRWIHNFWLRAAHLGAILFVAVESLAGLMCPLTVWEDLLRGKDAGGAGFIQRWVSRMLYYDLPGSAFTAIYVLFAAIVVMTFWKIPPREKNDKTRDGAN